jgi:origin recognition complex subunit 4
MDDSPRASKRRKLDTPKRTVSSPLVKGSAKRASGRLANRVASYAYTNGGAEEDPEQLAKSAKKGTAAKRTAVPDIDVYDDIEGALNVEPSAKPTPRRTVAASRDGTERTADELQDVATTSKRGRGRPRKAPTASRSAAKKSVNGHEHEDGETDIQDELGVETASPSKRGKVTRTPAGSARKPSAPRSTAGRRAASPVVEEDEDTESNMVLGTPSKLRSTKKPARSARKQPASDDESESIGASPSKSAKKRQPLPERTVVPDTEDELVIHPPRSIKKQTPSARRRSNRADNTSNRDDGEDAGENEDDEDGMDVDGNSVMESILDPTEPSPFNKPTSAQKKAAAAAAVPLIYGNLPAGRELDLLKTVVLERIAAKRSSPLVNLDAEYTTVHQLVEQTVTAGEGNSMLLIGARGSGKTALVNKVLSEVSKDNGGEYHVVRLNGFIHTDDKIALREIWRQLGKEMDVEEDGSGPGKNYADTLATLLALLSHPSEHTGEYTDQVAKAVIFVMDEFDLFAQHPRQTLLYNLFDIAQSRKAPIAVLGLTTRIDVTNSLEKRVKSRFSHRYVHLSLAKTFTAFQEMCKAGLIIEPEHLSVEERGILEGGAKSAAANSTPAKKAKKDAKQDVLAEWNANINVSPLIPHHASFTTNAQRRNSSHPLPSSRNI